LEGAAPDLLDSLARAGVQREFQPGQVILQEGAASSELYLILEGSVEVVKGKGSEEMVLTRRGPGDVLGEMALFEARPRSASLRAAESARLLELPEQDMRALLARQPQLLYRFMRELSARLRATDAQMISELQHRNEALSRAYRQLQEAQAGLLEKERLEHELELARRIQQDILPWEFPQHLGVQFAACSRPARQVGGDLYDVISLSQGRVGLVMADVSDKGMPAALFMALTRSLIRAEAKRSTSPRQVLLSVHRLLREVSQARMFVTVFYGVLDPLQGTLRYARAGHDRPLLVNRETGECRALGGLGTPLGYLSEVALEEEIVALSPGELLILYTDGITDALSPSDEFFGMERLRDAVSAGCGLGAQGCCDLILERVERFQDGAAQHDDIALLVVQVDAGQENAG
jgi:sigma-B regulation protein RsbU (phosphoserine phosphatase)